MRGRNTLYDEDIIEIGCDKAKKFVWNYTTDVQPKKAKEVSYLRNLYLFTTVPICADLINSTRQCKLLT